MQLGCKARSLYNELRVSSQSSRGKSEQVTTSTLAAVANIIDAVKDLVTWLDRFITVHTSLIIAVRCDSFVNFFVLELLLMGMSPICQLRGIS